MPQVDMTLNEAARSFTGWDVIAIEKKTGRKFAELDGVTLTRAAVWVLGNRDGDTMEWKAAMDLTLGYLDDYFIKEDHADPLGQENDGTT